MDSLHLKKQFLETSAFQAHSGEVQWFISSVYGSQLISELVLIRSPQLGRAAI